MRITRIIAAGALAAATAGGGVAGAALASTGTASAATTVYSTTHRTETLTTPRCYREHQVTTTYFGWSSKVGHYVSYPAPRVTTSDSTHCHK